MTITNSPEQRQFFSDLVFQRTGKTVKNLISSHIRVPGAGDYTCSDNNVLVGYIHAGSGSDGFGYLAGAREVYFDGNGGAPVHFALIDKLENQGGNSCIFYGYIATF